MCLVIVGLARIIKLATEETIGRLFREPEPEFPTGEVELEPGSQVGTHGRDYDGW